MAYDGIPIGELSRRTGCNIETIRYYEGISLLPTPRRRGRFRFYGDGDVARLIPTLAGDDSSIAYKGWYRAPGWRVAARKTKTIPTIILYDRWYESAHQIKGQWIEAGDSIRQIPSTGMRRKT